MFIAAVILLSISLIFFGVWVHAMFAMVKQKKPEFKKVDRETKTSKSSVGLTGFSKEVSFVKEKGYEAEMKAGMTYSEIAEGIKRKDPNVFIFLRIMIGFGVGILAGLASIGLFVASYGNSDGYFILGVSCFFTFTFLFIIINQRIKNRKPE